MRLAILAMLVLLCACARPCRAFDYTSEAFVTGDDPNPQHTTNSNAPSVADLSTANNIAHAEAFATNYFPSPPHLGASATATSVNDNPVFGGAGATGKVTATDHLTVIAPLGSQPIFLSGVRTTLLLEGNLDASGTPTGTSGAVALVTYLLDIPYTGLDGTKHIETMGSTREFDDSNDAQFPVGSGSGRQVGNGKLSNSIDFNSLFDSRVSDLGQWDLTLTLEADAYAAGAGVSDQSSFSDTLQVAGFTFYDSNGNPVPDLRVVGDAGNEYPVEVPEPTCLLLPIAGILLLARRRLTHSRPG